MFLVKKVTHISKEKQQIVQDVKKTLENYAADVKEEGLMAEFRYLDSSADFYWLPPGYSNILYYDSISAILKRNAYEYTQIDNRYDSLNVIAISPDKACLRPGSILL